MIAKISLHCILKVFWGFQSLMFLYTFCYITNVIRQQYLSSKCPIYKLKRWYTKDVCKVHLDQIFELCTRFLRTVFFNVQR